MLCDFPEGLSPDSPANRAAPSNSGLYKPQCATVCELQECKLSFKLASVRRRARLLPPLCCDQRREMCVNEPHDRFFKNKNWTGSSFEKHVPLSKNGFDAHTKCLSSLRSLPRPISAVPRRRCVHRAYVTVPKAFLKKTTQKPYKATHRSNDFFFSC